MNIFTKRLFLIALLTVSGLFAFAQDFDANRGKLSDTYQRNSISKMYISYGDRFDNMVGQYVSNVVNFGEKFDKNEIGISSLRSNKKRGEAGSLAIVNSLNQQGVGRSILSYWFQRDSNGKMSYDLVQQRSLYNINAKDLMENEGAEVQLLQDMGDKLINNSYVVVFDLKKCEKKETKDKKTGKVSVSYQAEMAAYAYQLDFTEDMLNQLYETTWIRDNDDAKTKAAKKKAFDEFVAPMKSAGATVVRYSAKTEQEAINGTFNRILHNLEKSIDAWQVKTDIVSTHPITARIGTKENLKNGDRYKVFAYKEATARTAQGTDTTVLRKVRYGFVRATTIADNAGKITDKDMPTSRFYQIHGRHLEEGMLLQEAKDLKIGVDLGVRPIGGVSLVYLDIDYLMHINNMGMTQYLKLFGGFDFGEIKAIPENPYIGVGSNRSFLDFGIGYGFGIPLTRLFEVQPYIKGGFDSMSTSDSDNIAEDDEGSFGTFFGEVGAMVSVQPIHCVRIFVQADYSLRFGGKWYPTEVERFGMNRFGLGLSVGGRYSF